MKHPRKRLSINKPVLFAKNPASRGKAHHQSHSPEQVKAFLLKYFPKYIHEDLEIPLPKGSLTTRLKHIKLIKNLYLDDTKRPHSNLWRLIISNKAKTLQYFQSKSDGRYRTTYSKRSLQKLKRLPGQQELSLHPPDPADSKDPSLELHYFKRSSFYLGILNHLKLLDLSLSEQKLLPTIAKVNKNERILSHLQTFSLTCTWIRSQDHQIFRALLNYNTVLKYLVFLDLATLTRKEFFQVLQQLPAYCDRLHGLYLSTSQKELTDANCFPECFDENTCLEDENYLRCLEDFKHLKKLHLISLHSLAFLQNAKLPPSLQSLRLEFSLFVWENYENFNVNMSPFHSSLKNLQNLKDLKLWFTRAPDEAPPSEKYLLAKKSFIESLLKNIPRLTQLSVVLSRQFYFDPNLETDPVFFDFSYFLACISHCCDSFEVLDIEDRAEFFEFTTQSGSLHFPKLSSFSLIGKISDLDLQSVLGLASKIELDKIIVESLKKLLDVFLLVAQVKDIENKQVKIKIDAGNIERNSSDESYFKENYEEVKKRIQVVNLKGVSLTISANRKELMFQKEIESFEDIFGKVKIESNFYLY